MTVLGFHTAPTGRESLGRTFPQGFTLGCFRLFPPGRTALNASLFPYLELLDHRPRGGFLYRSAIESSVPPELQRKWGRLKLYIAPRVKPWGFNRPEGAAVCLKKSGQDWYS